MTADGEAGAGGQEYVTDVAYLRNFVDDLAPTRLRLVAALNGFSPPPAEGFDYCEIGCGNGDTTATLAAACPSSRFLGVDLNPEHVAFARGLAERGALSNVRFLAGDFEELERSALPDFDFVTAHGLFSWIGPSKRRAFIDLASAKLKPGGLCFVSYNALPGWAAVEPLRRLMLDSASGVAGNSLDRARQGLQAAKLLEEAGAAYFTSNPSARSMLEAMGKNGLSYVAHEYFHAHFAPMYFADVAQEMAERDLYFVGQLPVHLNYRDLALPPALVALLKGVTNRIAFEGVKDFALNESFRRDVYVKGKVGCSPATTAAYLEQTRFGPAVGVGHIAREARLSHYSLRYAGAVFDALIPALSTSAPTMAELRAQPALAPFATSEIRDALLRLALGDQISPMAAPARAEPRLGTGSEARSYRLLSPYNRMIMQQRLTHTSPFVLASPVAGTGVVATMLQGVAIRLLTEIEPAARDAWLAAFVERTPLRLFDGGRAVTDKKEQAMVISNEIARFCHERFPELIRLGVLEEA